MENFKLNSIEEALDDFRNGKFVIVVDDEVKFSATCCSSSLVARRMTARKG